MSDISHEWLNLARRMQQIGKRQSGFAVVTVRVLINPDGNPEFWFEPELHRIEPMHSSSHFITQMMQVIGNKGDM